MRVKSKTPFGVTLLGSRLDARGGGAGLGRVEGARDRELGLVLSPSGAVVWLQALSLTDMASAVCFPGRPCSLPARRDAEGGAHTC